MKFVPWDKNIMEVEAEEVKSLRKKWDRPTMIGVMSNYVKQSC